MDVPKMKYLKQTQAKVYNCTFQLELFQLRIYLKFPCKFFIEWRTTSGNQVTKTQGYAECIDGKALFNEKLLLQVEMLYDSSKNAWIRKDSTINVYLVTRNKPDFNQLAGRINIDLSSTIQNNPYKKALTESLTYSSTSADLKFSLNMKYSLQSTKSIAQLNLLEFNDRLYLVKQNANMSKSKSLDYLKNVQHMVSPVYQVKDSPNNNTPFIIEKKPLKFPITKLENLGHKVLDSVDLGSNLTGSSSEFDIRMTLGNDKKAISREDYEDMIQLQTKGMKKSNLMVVPDIKKSRVEEEESQPNTQHQKIASDDDFPITHKQYIKEIKMQKSESQKKCQYIRPQSPQSDVDIIVDLSDNFHSKDLNQKNQGRNNLINSMNSSNNSFSLSRFRAQFEGSGAQNFSKSKSPKESFNSMEIQPNLSGNGLYNDELSHWKRQYEQSRNSTKRLQAEVNELVKILRDNKEKLQQLEQQNNSQRKTMQQLQDENEQLNYKMSLLQKKATDLHEKAEYETKINILNCEKLKKISSQLTLQRSRIRSSQNSPLSNETNQLKVQLNSLRQKLKTVNMQKKSFQEKLFKRDQIQLQNEIRIQELQDELKKCQLQSHKTYTKSNSLLLQVQSKITNKSVNPISQISQSESKQQQYINILQQKIQSIEQQNSTLKNLCNQNNKKLQKVIQKDKTMKNNLVIIQKEFESIAKQLLEKEKLLKQKVKEVEAWKNKSHLTKYNSQAFNQLKQRPLEEEIKKKEHMVQDLQIHIQSLEEELDKVKKQNKQLTDTYNKLMRESFRFEGDLKVIKEEESFRQSVSFRQSFGSSGERFGSSGQGFRQSLLTLTIKQENIVALYKQTVQSFYTKMNMSQKFEIQFSSQLHEIKRKAFTELERSTNIINELLKHTQSIETELQSTNKERQKVEKILQAKLQEMQEIEEQQLNSAGSTNITPLIGSSVIKPLEGDKFDHYSQATKKRSVLNLNRQNNLNREVEKLKSIIYDKNKEISDLIASYEKLKLQKQTQFMLIKSKNLKIQERYEDESDAEFVHDILDLQIRLNKEKEKKNQVMEELELRKSLNRSQQVSQYIQTVDISTIYKEIRAIITSRQNYIQTEQSLNKLVIKINEMGNTSEKRVKKDKLIYLVEEKTRSISKQLQVMKSTLMKMDFKQLQTMQCKTLFFNIFKPSQQAITELLTAVEQILNNIE